jgi:hypothetical protein
MLAAQNASFLKLITTALEDILVGSQFSSPPQRALLNREYFSPLNTLIAVAALGAAVSQAPVA